MRKLVTHLVFQFQCFSESDIPALRETLANNRDVYFEGLNKGFDSIYPKSIREMVGESYDKLIGLINESIGHRNKIFHGQLTDKYLSREELFAYVDEIEEWCRRLSDAAEQELGYNGFVRNSFQKSSRNEFYKTFKVSFESIADYKSFVKEIMQRSKAARVGTPCPRDN
jgi:hypothetical protein